MNRCADPEFEVVARQATDAGWPVVAAVHSRAGVELQLLPAFHVWDFLRPGQRFAYGRDDCDALRRFLRQLTDEQVMSVGTG